MFSLSARESTFLLNGQSESSSTSEVTLSEEDNKPSY